jgi:hypothetical protein
MPTCRLISAAPLTKWLVRGVPSCFREEGECGPYQMRLLDQTFNQGHYFYEEARGSHPPMSEAHTTAAPAVAA